MNTEIIDDALWVYNVTPETIDQIEISENIKQLHITGDFLEHFSIPEGLTDVHINSMGLKTIYIPDGLESLYISRNFLRTIEIPNSLLLLEAHHNLLSEITFRSLPSHLRFIDIKSNRFTRLDFQLPENINYLNAALNNLEFISPQIENFFTTQYIPKCISPPTSDDEDWYVPFVLSKSY